MARDGANVITTTVSSRRSPSSRASHTAPRLPPSRHRDPMAVRVPAPRRTCHPSHVSRYLRFHERGHAFHTFTCFTVTFTSSRISTLFTFTQTLVCALEWKAAARSPLEIRSGSYLTLVGGSGGPRHPPSPHHPRRAPECTDCAQSPHRGALCCCDGQYSLSPIHPHPLTRESNSSSNLHN